MFGDSFVELDQQNGFTEFVKMQLLSRRVTVFHFIYMYRVLFRRVGILIYRGEDAVRFSEFAVSQSFIRRVRVCSQSRPWPIWCVRDTHHFVATLAGPAPLNTRPASRVLILFLRVNANPDPRLLPTVSRYTDRP